MARKPRTRSSAGAVMASRAGAGRPPIYDSGVDRLLLILPSATYRAPDFMAAARELGVAVTVASERRAAMSAAMGERALTLRLSDPARAAEQIADRAREHPVRGDRRRR